MENSNLPNLQKDFDIKLCVKFRLLRLTLILNSRQATIKKSNNSCKNIKDKNLSLINIIELCAEFQLDRYIINFYRCQTAFKMADNSC